jgi:biopolymer transport protein ExbB
VTGHTLLDLVRQGGFVLYPLVLCSVVSVAIILERAWSLVRSARQARALHRLIEEAWSEQSLAEVLAICRRDPSPLGPVYLALLGQHGAGAEMLARIAQRKLAEANRRLRRFVWLLGTIGSLAPFIGLLGTVVGIIRAFDSMAAAGSGGFAVVAAGVAEALIATAGGLLVGVLCIFAYNSFQVRLNTLAAEWREQLDDFLVRLSLMPRIAEAVPRVVQSR